MYSDVWDHQRWQVHSFSSHFCLSSLDAAIESSVDRLGHSLLFGFLGERADLNSREHLWQILCCRHFSPSQEKLSRIFKWKESLFSLKNQTLISPCGEGTFLKRTISMNSGHLSVKMYALIFQITNGLSRHTVPDQSQLSDTHQLISLLKYVCYLQLGIKLRSVCADSWPRR